MKAAYAYHELPADNLCHFFNGHHRENICVNCGRSREDVRWDDLDYHCEKHNPDIYNPLKLSFDDRDKVKCCIHGEELRFTALLERATSDVPRLITKMGMSGDTLAVLHHTHGYDPETVDSVVNVPPDMMHNYYEKMEIERERSRSATVKMKIKMTGV